MTRHPQVIAGALRENAERLQQRMREPSSSLTRILQLLDELDEALVLNQLEQSLKLIEDRKIQDTLNRA